MNALQRRIIEALEPLPLLPFAGVIGLRKRALQMQDLICDMADMLGPKIGDEPQRECEKCGAVLIGNVRHAHR